MLEMDALLLSVLHRASSYLVLFYFGSEIQEKVFLYRVS